MSSLPLSSVSFAASIFSVLGPITAARPLPAHPVESRQPAVSIAGVTTASHLEVRPTPQMVSSGAAVLDSLTGGLPRGALTELTGPASGGRTSLLLAALAAASQRQEACALVDASNAFDPASGVAAGVEFSNLLWVRCGAGNNLSRRRRSAGKTISDSPVEQALRVTDLLLQSGGFGLVAIDFSDVPAKMARRVPLTTWFRFRRAVEPTPTMLLLVTRAACAQSCASLLVQVRAEGRKLPALSPPGKDFVSPAHCTLLGGLRIHAELVRSRIERKPVGSAQASIRTAGMRAG